MKSKIEYTPVNKEWRRIINKPNTREVLNEWNDYMECNMAFPILAANPIPLVIIIWQILVLWPLYILFYPFKY